MNHVWRKQGVAVRSGQGAQCARIRNWKCTKCGASKQRTTRAGATPQGTNKITISSEKCSP